MPGSYALLLHAAHEQLIEVGACGTLHILPGWYIYVGSALGPGGLRGRINHHLRLASRPHWHIDYLRRATELAAIWFEPSPARLEHLWAQSVAAQPGAQLPLPRFGASDCACAAHLFFFSASPTFSLGCCKVILDCCGAMVVL